MTKKEIEEVEILAANMRQASHHLREGQAFFNALHQLHPDRANLIRGTTDDMFYINDNIRVFKELMASAYESKSVI